MSITSSKTSFHPKISFLPEGRLELRVPLAIGTLQWGTTWLDHKLINSPNGNLSDDICREIVAICSAHDIQLYDTAEGYGGGTSEKRLSRLMMIPSGPSSDHSRDTIFMTKFLPAPWRLFHSDLEYAVRESCRRLKVACIPIYLLHSPVHWLRGVEYWVEACARCKRQGLIQCMGLSNCNAEQVRRAVVAGREHGIDVVCNQVHYSLLDYGSHQLREMERTCRELGVRIVAFSPIGQGLLTDKLTTEQWKHKKIPKMLHLKWDDLSQLRQTLDAIAKKYEKSMAQVAINWCIQHGVIPLVGCRSPSRLMIRWVHWAGT